MTVRLAPDVDLTAYTVHLADELAPIQTDGYDIAVAQAAGFTSNTINVIVSGADPATVKQANDAVLAALADNGDLLNLKSDLSQGTPEIRVTPDPNKSILVGLTTAQVGQEVRGALVGTTATQVQLPDEDGTTAIVVRLDPDQVTSVDTLKPLPVGTVAKVPLGQIATVEQANAQGSITRIDGSPAASISADIANVDTGAVSVAVQKEIDGLVTAGQIPSDVDVRLAGVTQQQNEAFGGLFTSMAVAILLVYLAMVLTFNSLDHAVHHPVHAPARDDRRLPGAVPDRPAHRRQRPHRVPDADRDRGHQRHRAARPRRTAATRGHVHLRRPARGRSDPRAADPDDGDRDDPRAGPARRGFNQGSIIAAELGTVVIGGLLSSTFLTLLVIPVVYSLVDGVRRRASRRFAQPEGDAAEQVEAAPAGLIRAA